MFKIIDNIVKILFNYIISYPIRLYFLIRFLNHNISFGV